MYVAHTDIYIPHSVGGRGPTGSPVTRKATPRIGVRTPMLHPKDLSALVSQQTCSDTLEHGWDKEYFHHLFSLCGCLADVQTLSRR